MRRCGVPFPPPPPPQPIIFEWLKLPQQIIYRRKGNLSESTNHLKYWENILVSRFYEQFSRSSRNLGHFWKFEKFQTLRTQTYHISFWSGWSGDSRYIICFAKCLNFGKIKAIMYFAKFLNAFVKPRTAASFYSAKLRSSLYREVRYIRSLLYRDSTVCNFALLRGEFKGKR